MSEQVKPIVCGRKFYGADGNYYDCTFVSFLEYMVDHSHYNGHFDVKQGQNAKLTLV